MKKVFLFSFLLASYFAQSQSALITPNTDGNGNFLFKSTGINYGQFSTTESGASLVFRIKEPVANNGSTGLRTGAIYSDDTRTVLAGYTDKAQLYGINSVEIGTNDVSDRMVITSTGRVGIGTISPNSKFEVFNEGLNDLRITSNTIGGFGNFFQPASSRLSFFYEKGTADEWRPGYIQANDNGNFTGRLDFYTNGTGTGNKMGNIRSMSITKGNVGVGTTTPLTKMDVNGPIMTRDRLVFGNQNGNDPATNPVWVTDNYNNDFRLFQQPTLSGIGNVRMIVQNASGNVGIGTESPTYKLQVVGDIKMQGADFFIGPVAGRGAGGRALVLDGNNMLSINFANDFTGGTFINSNVGIGTIPNNSYKLSINGTTRSKEVIVETGWADYVFEENYKLRSIDEMEVFIKENKHLPNIPKSSEIEKNGMKVGETNKAMMEKIEELALYIIQLKKEIDILKSKN